MAQAAQGKSRPVHDLQQPLLSGSFGGLLATQFLTAINDNILRWLVIGVGKELVTTNVSLVLTIGTACYVAPFILFASTSGYLADKYSKRSVIVACKVGEIAIMIAASFAIYLQNLPLLFVVVALTGVQSALFTPAKLGSIPEMLSPDKISKANGMFGLVTVMATAVGMAIGNVLSDWTTTTLPSGIWLPSAVLIGIAVVGWLVSLPILSQGAANPQRAFPWNIVGQTWNDIRTLASHAALLRVALGIVFFWSVGALAQLNIDQYAFEGGATQQADIIPFLIALIIGVSLGSVIAGVWSGDHVELGILPLGAGGVAISSVLLYMVEGSLFNPEIHDGVTLRYSLACFFLFLLGFSAGLFDVPLEAYMQHRSPRRCRGAILAASNMLTFAGMLLMAVLFSGLRIEVRAGELANVPLIPDVELTAAQDSALTKSAERISARVKSGKDSRLAEEIASHDELSHDYTIARLVWAEIQASKAKGVELDQAMIDSYQSQFPEQELLVEEIVDEAGGSPLLSSREVFLLCGVFTLFVFTYIVWLIPQATIRFLVWLLSKTIYRIKVYGRENLPETGGALLVPNHVSWLDGPLLLLTSSRPVRIIVDAGNFESRLMTYLANMFGAILLRYKPKAIVKALREARQALKNGELVCIFPEGGISRTGQIQSFKPGMMKILDGTGAPIVPVYLDELWGSIFSFQGGKFFWKWPQKFPYPISIHFGKPVEGPHDLHSVRQAVQQLGAQAVAQRMTRSTSVPQMFIRTAKKRKFGKKIFDSTGGELTGGQLLTRTLVLRRLLNRHVLAADEKYVGVLLPPSAGGVIVNAALAIDRRVSVNLNYTVSSEVMNSCLEQAGVKHVLTSRKFMDKFDFDLDAEVVYLEDFKEKPTTGDKLFSAFQAYVTPASMLERALKLPSIDHNDVLTVIFTSGSTGTPKGVMLTHRNIASNVEAIDQVVHLRKSDTILGLLPFFHSFGYTVTLWGSLGLDIKGAFHFNPLDPKQIGKLCEKHGCTVLLATPTFLRSYLRRCTKEQFATLDVVVVGAEKLPADLADAFEEKFGVRPVEGYGCTELSPLVSVNIPPSRSIDNFQVDAKEGTVGRPIPGVSARVLDLDSGEELGAEQDGMLYISGPNVMRGYLGREDLTNEVVTDGWYKTGDVAHVDADGFIKITGRVSRFSKIGGEMVPHLKIEEALNECLGSSDGEAQDDDGDGHPDVSLAVTSAPDPKKGEKLVVLHAKIDKTPAELCKHLAEKGFPNLFIPSEDCFFEMEKIPLLGTGKLDLKAIQQVAKDKCS